MRESSPQIPDRREYPVAYQQKAGDGPLSGSAATGGAAKVDEDSYGVDEDSYGTDPT
jgi:hypothetical protein